MHEHKQAQDLKFKPHASIFQLEAQFVKKVEK